MTVLSSPLYRGAAATEDRQSAFGTVTQVARMIQQSNHATAFAAWVVATIGMGLVIEIGQLRSVGSLPVAVLMIGLLTAVLLATARVLVLLVRAGRVAAFADSELHRFTGAAIDAGHPFSVPEPQDPPTAEQAWEQVRSLAAATMARDVLARRALNWAYGSGSAFLFWSLLAGLLSVGS